MTHRPAWDDYFMAMARLAATRATCDRLHAGAVLVQHNRVVSTGYNGAPPGAPHCDDDGHLMEDGHCVGTVHGEHNAILQAAVIGGSSTLGTTMYTIYSPCIHCAKYVVTAGVQRVVIAEIYRNSTAPAYLESAGVQVDMYTPTPGWNQTVADLFSSDIEKKTGPQIDLKRH